ncbi:amino acid deaminase [Chachezhania sediminis]|uniref:amino acid deaminase n=1 Tax=Chachezhania sediminis TaxID=2599291 RepID=UPI00131C0A0D|nr:amino acid deaminase [Chachezhania sediminis]
MTPFSPRPWEAPLTALDKGIPLLAAPLPLDRVAAQGWSLAAEDLPLPAALLRSSALENNSAWMRRYLDRTGASIAPHGKTSMAPALFDLQMRDGAWAITVSTPQHVAVALACGYDRIFMANQLVGRRGIADVLSGLKAHPEADFFCLVDDPANVRALAQAVRDIQPGRPLKVLVELGYDGGRTGCRSVVQALDLARLVHAQTGMLELAGIEGFEGLLKNDGTPEVLAQVEQLLSGMVDLARMADAEDLYSGPEVLLSAGGSSYYDIVAARLSAANLSRPARVLIRSGCYITHDSHMYVRARNALARRDPDLASTGDLQPALEVWALVQSRPEPGKAIVAFGKRDSSHDDMPIPLKWLRPGLHDQPVPAPPGARVDRLNDQHCHLIIPPDSPLQVGDMLGFGISHPCLTFDKWRVLLLVDDAYRVTGAIRTYF